MLPSETFRSSSGSRVYGASRLGNAREFRSRYKEGVEKEEVVEREEEGVWEVGKVEVGLLVTAA